MVVTWGVALNSGRSGGVLAISGGSTGPADPVDDFHAVPALPAVRVGDENLAVTVGFRAG
ncbi:hypothetical protein ACFLTJ_00870 [Chloroflexota bacterium]